MNRRHLLQGSVSLGGMGLLAGCATTGPAIGSRSLLAPSAVPPLAPVRASLDRVFDVTVCLRPFRAAGPRIEAEQIGEALVVHNYGHGGSGWSLSWGSGTVAVEKAMANSPREVAVIGCGALGLTSAILAQQAGAQVTIYARDLMPDTRSARATGSWTPDSRIALTSAAGPGFADLWERMARISFKTYRRYLGLPGIPVEWNDRYFLSNVPPEQQVDAPDPLGFAGYRERIRDLMPRSQPMPPGSTPFPTRYVRRSASMMFNIADYGHTLLGDFRAAGGKVERREFHHPAEFANLPQKVVINCPGYGARALCRDESIIPVRGQISWLIPQPEVNYGVVYKDVSMLARRDGIVIQSLEGGDIQGYNNTEEVPDRAETTRSVGVIAELYARPWGARSAA